MRSPLPGSLLVLLLATSAHARLLRTLDLTSLSLTADTVVAAEGMDRQGDMGHFRVTRVLAGSGVEVGQTLAVDLSCYVFGESPAGFPPPLPPLQPTAFLFLGPAPEGGPRPLVGSGLRVVADGRVYRFRQFSNPGCYAPEPQPAERDAASRPGAAAVSLEAFEPMLRAALDRAAQLRTALGAPAASRRAALLALLPPPVETFLPGLSLSDTADVAASQAMDALLEVHDDVGALEVRARSRDWTRSPARFERAGLLQVIGDPEAAPHLKVAALGMLAWDDFAPVPVLLQVARAAPDGRVRAAAWRTLERLAWTSSDAAWNLARAKVGPRLRGPLVARSREEQDPRARQSLYACARAWRLAGVRGPPALVAEREGSRVDVRVVVAPPDSPRRVAAELSENGKACAAEVESQGGDEVLLWTACTHGPLDVVAKDGKRVWGRVRLP